MFFRLLISALLILSVSAGAQLAAPERQGEFTAPRKTVSEVKAMLPSKTRVVVSGVVTYSHKYGTFHIDDGTGTAWVYAPGVALNDMTKLTGPISPAVPLPGQRVEVEAEQRMKRDPSPALFDASWRVIGETVLPPPTVVTQADIIAGQFDGRRVRIRGRMIAFEQYTDGPAKISRSWFRAGEHVVYANLIDDRFHPAPAQPGSLVEYDGVCVVNIVGPRLVRYFVMHLNSPGDARAVPEPFSWEKARPALIIAGVLLVACAWIFLLRRQIRLRTATLAAREAELRVALESERELGRLKSSFVSLVSHEFRTPLEVILSSTDILDRYLARLSEEERASHFAAIQSSVKRMAGMMEEALVLGRLDSGRMRCQPDDLHLTRWCGTLLDEMRSATAARCPIEMECGEFEPIVQADESLLRHIFTNLLGNAAKYSEPGTPVKFSITREGADAVFQITDSGIGIPEQDRVRIFEGFHRGKNTAHTNGTGLGLVIVKRCVELHGGSINFTSEVGRGTTFTVRLPLFASHHSQPSSLN